MKLALALVLVFATPALAADFEAGVSAMGWFISASGEVDGRDVEEFGLDDAIGQPEVRGHLGYGRHRIETSILLIDREESRTTTQPADPLGLISVESRLSMAIEATDFRFHYGFSVLRNETIDLQPFIGLAYITEESLIVDDFIGQESRTDEEVILPLPGADLVLLPSSPIRLRGRLSGISTGDDFLFDAEGGIEGQWKMIFAGLGWRHVAVRIERENGQGTLADLDLSGVWIQAGARF